MTTLVMCEHRSCERGQRHNGCAHYGLHEHSERCYCHIPCPKNGAICKTAAEIEEKIKKFEASKQ